MPDSFQLIIHGTQTKRKYLIHRTTGYCFKLQISKGHDKGINRQALRHRQKHTDRKADKQTDPHNYMISLHIFHWESIGNIEGYMLSRKYSHMFLCLVFNTNGTDMSLEN